MEDKRHLFGTDGIRGQANVYPMTGEVAMALGRAVTYYFKKKELQRRPIIVIGKDTRRSCYMLEQAFASGVCSQGGRAIFTGPLPTPGVAFVTTNMRAHAGVMISASHNSFEDNGIKIFDHSGHKLPDAIELKLEELVKNPSEIPAPLGQELGRAKRLDEVIGRYVVHAKSALNYEGALEGLKIVLDCANGAGYKLGPIIFEELGAKVIPLGVSPNGLNINKNCGALHPEEAAKVVKEQGADLGICLDGDGDRVTVVGPKGEIIDGDKILGLSAHFLRDQGELGASNEVVATVMSNLGLENYLKNLGVHVFRTKVGDRYIVERMRQSGALFGGEPSGHIIFKKHSTTGDGIMAGIKIIECLRYFNKNIDDLARSIELYPQKLINVEVKEKRPFKELPHLQKRVSEIEKEFKSEGRVLLRYSGTEKLARVMVEGRNPSLVEKHCQEIADILKEELENC